VRLLVLDWLFFFGGGGDDTILDISSSWVERSLHAKFQLLRLPRSGSSMVVETTTKTTKQNNSVELEATLAWAEVSAGAVAKADQNSLNLAPAEAEVGAVAKADQKLKTKWYAHARFWLWYARARSDQVQNLHAFLKLAILHFLFS
jgi:hypothetical protein